MPRLTGWLLFTLGLCVLIYILAPHQLSITAYKLSLVTLGGVVGYWLSRATVKLRVGDCIGPTRMALILHRSICVAGFALALSLAA